MKPAAFKYFAPSSIREAVDYLETYGDEAKILAGGQSLVPIMNFRLGRPEVLIDINRIKELDYIKVINNGETRSIAIGALTRERSVELNPEIQEKCPVLSAAISNIGHVTIRNRGTIGGSLVHADPSAEIPTVMCALGGEFKAVGPDGERTLDCEEFFMTYLTTSLEPSELLVEVKVPILSDGTGWSFMELSRRVGDFAIAAVAVILMTEADGSCKQARISLGGVAPTPVRAEEAEERLAGRKITTDLIMEAGRLAIEATDAESDYHATADYRREMTRVLVQRALTQALGRVKKGE